MLNVDGQEEMSTVTEKQGQHWGYMLDSQSQHLRTFYTRQICLSSLISTLKLNSGQIVSFSTQLLKNFRRKVETAKTLHTAIVPGVIFAT